MLSADILFTALPKYHISFGWFTTDAVTKYISKNQERRQQIWGTLRAGRKTLPRPSKPE